MSKSALDALRGPDADRWGNVATAQSLSEQKWSELASLVAQELTTDEVSFVVFGSLAREEFTLGSDLDWTLLIDGRADSGHLEIVHSIRAALGTANYKVPGPTEMFGGMIFSHDLVHAIGGDEDTNKNMTRRLLLLLESTAIGTSTQKAAHERLIRGILGRYVEEDANFITGNTRHDKIPRFLLNDVVRFWRTMAVDYANKYRARAGDKWALRNIKLRMSRKLLFISGFFMCISWALGDRGNDVEQLRQDLIAHLMSWTQRSPLESLAGIVQQYGPSLKSEIFDSYDAFLALLNDDDIRKYLEKLSPEEAYTDSVFLEARETATKFDAALTTLLFDTNKDITRLVHKYGVF
ncbi:DUF294 nucleotidyltransferase-like domain-containing protein [Aminobacter sp. MET-1]|uniref:DUF294 nucleotidyltransferase-like domain-containing protein n=1 Tax=Aminobacter sp. MET-1 TaxID=2951085 RepID=UPI002269E117|nr:DUF294 nucleotidyltransferase-like domain-containing protein [Aminobacter sp. MET-1]MCX8568393.1 DUF294 nucleotidyltransferase-like domain-containing protein [Aminobacter sp. MET-1]